MLTILLVSALSRNHDAKIEWLTHKIALLHIKRGEERMKAGKNVDAAEDFLAALAEVPNEPNAIKNLEEVEKIINESKNPKYSNSETQTEDSQKNPTKNEGPRVGPRSKTEEGPFKSIKVPLYESCDKLKKLAEEWKVNEDDSFGDIVAAKVVKSLANHCPSGDKKEEDVKAPH